MGTGNDMDDNVRARGANASIVGEPFDTNETKDLFLENQELKVIINYLGQQKMKNSIEFFFCIISQDLTMKRFCFISGGNSKISRTSTICKNCWNVNGKPPHSREERWLFFKVYKRVASCI